MFFDVHKGIMIKTVEDILRNKLCNFKIIRVYKNVHIKTFKKLIKTLNKPFKHHLNPQIVVNVLDTSGHPLLPPAPKSSTAT